MKRKTVIIYDQCEANVTFIVLDGDYRHLNRIYVNQVVGKTKKEQKAAEKLQEELCDLIYHPKTGDTLVSLLTEFPLAEVQNGADVIVAGFLP
jgi:uncharacterized membrane protein YheB (UPF0754 family)